MSPFFCTLKQRSSILAVILFLGSLWLVIVFPGFIRDSVRCAKLWMRRGEWLNKQRRQGANPEVLGRLQYFKELNSARTVFRFFYALCLSTLSIDAWTEHKAVNMSPYVCAVMLIGPWRR